MINKEELQKTCNSLLKYDYHLNKKGLIESSNIVLSVIFSLQNNSIEELKTSEIEADISMQDWLRVTGVYITTNLITMNQLQEIISMGNSIIPSERGNDDK